MHTLSRVTLRWWWCHHHCNYLPNVTFFISLQLSSRLSRARHSCRCDSLRRNDDAFHRVPIFISLPPLSISHVSCCHWHHQGCHNHHQYLWSCSEGVDENLMSSALIDFCTLMLLKAHSLKCHSDHDAINLGDDDDEDHRQPWFISALSRCLHKN